MARLSTEALAAEPQTVPTTIGTPRRTLDPQSQEPLELDTLTTRVESGNMRGQLARTSSSDVNVITGRSDIGPTHRPTWPRNETGTYLPLSVPSPVVGRGP